MPNVPHLSKTQAMGWTIGWAAFTLLLILFQAGGCIFWSLLITAVFGVVWYYKWQRDKQILAHARDRQLPAAQRTIPMADPRSQRLGVPKPLD